MISSKAKKDKRRLLSSLFLVNEEKEVQLNKTLPNKSVNVTTKFVELLRT
jgi:hypothetical protein